MDTDIQWQKKTNNGCNQIALLVHSYQYNNNLCLKINEECHGQVLTYSCPLSFLVMQKCTLPLNVLHLSTLTALLPRASCSPSNHAQYSSASSHRTFLLCSVLFTPITYSAFICHMMNHWTQSVQLNPTAAEPSSPPLGPYP